MAPKGRPPRAKGADGESQPAAKKKKITSKQAPATYERYIYKILKNVHPKMRISKQAMAIMNSQVNDTFERIASQAFQMARLTKSNALSSRDVTSACRLILPGQLAKHAIDEGTRCLMTYKEVLAKRRGVPMPSEKDHGRKSEKTLKTGIDSPTMDKEDSADM
jgi:histone H2B